MSVQSEIDRIKKNVDDTLKAISDTGVQVGTGSDALPAAARALSNEKQNKLTGTAGQFVGFGPDGNAAAKNVTAGDVTFSDGKTFQQKYDAGQLTGPAGKDGQTGPAGAPGKDGNTGPAGRDGAAATIKVGTVTTGEPGTQASVTNAGSTSAAVLNFTIPRGATGAAGAPGKDGTTGPAGAPGKNATINGVNALTVAAQNGISGSMSGTTFTLDGAGLMPKATRVVLASNGWALGRSPFEPEVGVAKKNTQKVTVSGVLADETKQLIMPMPAMASQAEYIKAGILCTGQATNSLTFTAQTVPTVNLTVYVTIQEVRT